MNENTENTEGIPLVNLGENIKEEENDDTREPTFIDYNVNNANYDDNETC